MGLQEPLLQAYTLPDTGQTVCYDNVQEIPCPQPGEPFYGQDAQYQRAQPAFLDNGDGTVTDLNTGLSWQQGDNQNGSPRTWTQASDYCATLDPTGQLGWRLPTRMELLSLVNYAIPIPGPTVDVGYFPDCLSDYYWSSSTITHYWDLGVPYDAWNVTFYYGCSRLANRVYNWTWGTQADNEYVRCVRGGNANASWVDNHDSTVSEILTGLMWQQFDDGVGRKWHEALAYCEGLDLAGHSDWRLPDMRELESLVDDSWYNPVCNPIFQCPASIGYGGRPYWSSTTDPYSPGQA
jgi:hypothetical protein